MKNDFKKYFEKDNLLKCTKRLFNIAKFSNNSINYNKMKNISNNKLLSIDNIKKVLRLNSIHSSWIARLSQINGSLEVLEVMWTNFSSVEFFTDINNNHKKRYERNSNWAKKIKIETPLFTEHGNFSSLKNLNKYLLGISFWGSIHSPGYYLESIFKTYHIIKTLLTYIITLILSDSLSNELKKSLIDIKNDITNFENTTNKYNFIDTNNSRKIITKELNYKYIGNRLFDEVSKISETSPEYFMKEICNNIWLSILKKPENIFIKEKERHLKILLAYKWFWTDDKYYLDLFELIIKLQKKIQNIINIETKIYIKDKLKLDKISGQDWLLDIYNQIP